MEEVGDPYTERRKVDILVKGATAPRLAATRTSIMQMEATRNDFQAAYTFIETMEQFDSTLSEGATAFDRNVGAVATEDGDIDTSRQDPAVWNAMSSEERKKVLQARGTWRGGKKKNNGGGGGGKGKKKNDKALGKLKRKLAELATSTSAALKTANESDNSSGGGSEPNAKRQRDQEESPASQFGRDSHQMKVMTSFVEAVEKLGKS